MPRPLSLVLITGCVAVGLVLSGTEGLDSTQPGFKSALITVPRLSQQVRPGSPSTNSQPDAALEKQPAQVWDALAELEFNPSPEAREQAIFALADVAGELARAQIQRALGDENPDVREAAIDALAELGDGPALEALAHSYYSETEELREEIVHVLAEIGGPVAIQLLLVALQDDSAVIRELAREHLRSH